MTTLRENQEKELSDAHYDFQKGLNSHAFFKIHNHALGEDLVQNTFLKTWSYLVKGGKIDVMKAFLYHILNNLIIDEYRKKKNVSLDAMLEKGFEPRGYEQNPVSALEGKSAILLIRRLPLMYQKIMRMKYVQGLTLEEMSLLTGQTKNSIAVQAHRGLDKLRLLYNPI